MPADWYCENAGWIRERQNSLKYCISRILNFWTLVDIEVLMLYSRIWTVVPRSMISPPSVNNLVHMHVDYEIVITSFLIGTCSSRVDSKNVTFIRRYLCIVYCKRYLFPKVHSPTSNTQSTHYPLYITRFLWPDFIQRDIHHNAHHEAGTTGNFPCLALEKSLLPLDLAVGYVRWSSYV